MNIVYLIGNGFDLKLEMRTKYEHFYEYYLSYSKESDSPHIKKLKETIAKDKKNWSDLELALGNYLSQLKEDEAVLLHRDLVEHLSKYLVSEEEKYIISDEQSHIFYSYLINPHLNDRLLPKEINKIERYRNRWSHTAWDIKLITFNYTKSIERIIGNRNTKGIGSHHNRAEILLSEIEHIHGFADNRLIIGVNDISQIANDKLNKKTRITDRYIKSECNSTYGLEHDEKCEQWINNANLICLFGLSFGDTDKKWWEIVGKALERGCKVILFDYNPDNIFNENQGPDTKEAKEAIKERFLEKTNLEDNVKNNVKKDIYVAYNTDMFKLKIEKKEKNNDTN